MKFYEVGEHGGGFNGRFHGVPLTHPEPEMLCPKVSTLGLSSVSLWRGTPIHVYLHQKGTSEKSGLCVHVKKLRLAFKKNYFSTISIKLWSTLLAAATVCNTFIYGIYLAHNDKKYIRVRSRNLSQSIVSLKKASSRS